MKTNQGAVTHSKQPTRAARKSKILSRAINLKSSDKLEKSGDKFKTLSKNSKFESSLNKARKGKFQQERKRDEGVKFHHSGGCFRGNYGFSRLRQ